MTHTRLSVCLQSCLVGSIAAPLGIAPRHLPALERNIWAEVVRIAPPNLLTKSDRIIVEIAVRLIARMRVGDYKTSDLNALSSVLAKIGFSPIDRIKMSLEPMPAPSVITAEDEAWDELAQLD
jgi:hypothetical protein